MFTCRVCLTFEDNLYPISDYIEDFFQLTGIKPEKESLLCPLCIRQLNDAIVFREKAIQADGVLQKAIKDELVKEEPVEYVEASHIENVSDDVLELTKDCPYCFLQFQDKNDLSKHVQEHIGNA